MSDPDLKADQKKLTAIEKEYREGNHELPPAELDAAVLARAHAAKFNKRGIWTSPRWIMGLATAAAVMLTVSVYRNVELEADLAGDLLQQNEARSQPGRGEPASESVSKLDGSSFRDAGGKEARANAPDMLSSTALVKPSVTPVSTEREVQQPASPKRSNAPTAIEISPALEIDTDAAARHRLSSQLGQRNAAISAVAQDTEASRDAAGAAGSLSASQPDKLTCLTQFTFPVESDEHVVNEDRVSYRLNGTLHTWRCMEDLWKNYRLTQISDRSFGVHYNDCFAEIATF